jgi:hypothetical protein
MTQSDGIFLDWVRLTCPAAPAQHYFHVENELGFLWGLGDERRLLGYDGQTLMALGFFGSRYNSCLEKPTDTDEGEWLFDELMEIPGELCALLGKTDLLRLCKEMQAYGFGATRLDIAFDLRDPSVNVKLIETMFKRQQIETSAAGRNAISGKAAPGEACTLDVGGTLNIGGRQSELYMKVYDKQTQHKKKTGIDIGHCTRFELEIKGEKANTAFRCICNGAVNNETGEIVGEFNLASFLKDFICFYKTPNKKEVCNWWLEIDQAPSMVWPPYEHHASLDATMHWLRSQVLPTIKTLEDFGYGAVLRDEINRSRGSRDLTKYLKGLKQSATASAVPF